MKRTKWKAFVSLAIFQLPGIEEAGRSSIEVICIDWKMKKLVATASLPYNDEIKMGTYLLGRRLKPALETTGFDRELNRAAPRRISRDLAEDLHIAIRRIRACWNGESTGWKRFVAVLHALEEGGERLEAGRLWLEGNDEQFEVGREERFAGCLLGG
ncbi:hypothetical protein M5K25_012846 [Dendrobium thyrsiflorum]|uniref:Uncharacterized protein n=1 Tax=Dendrobium thyrsiflorum TaxID=117978 RepID=A0ABD0UYK4_DENTH